MSDDLLGYFTTATQDKPAHDPGLEVDCVVCAKPLSKPMVTMSFLVQKRPNRDWCEL